MSDEPRNDNDTVQADDPVLDHECQHCNSAITETEYDDNELGYCTGCAEDRIVTCDRSRCTNQVDFDDTVEVSGDQWCESCSRNYSSVCADCDDRVDDDNLHSVENGNRSVCDSCYDNYYTCDSCNESCHSDNINTHNNSNYSRS